MRAWIEPLGWMLVHSVWLIAVVVGVAAVVMGAMRKASANARFVVGCVAMTVSLAMLPAALARVLRQPVEAKLERVAEVEPCKEPVGVSMAQVPPTVPEPAGQFVPVETRTVNEGPSVSEVPTVAERVERNIWQWVESQLRPWLAWLVAFWLVGVCLLSTRPLIGWRASWRLRRVGLSAVPETVAATLQRLTERLGLRRAVAMFQSSLVTIPCVVGAFKPVILLPASAITGLSPEQLEAVLAHELAHVRRHDFLVNALQTMAETLLFYHPAIWWLSRRVRHEREHCCDDLAVSLCNPAEYCRALVAIEVLRGPRSALALGATDGSLVSRVRRIAGVSPERSVGPWSVALLLGVALTGAIAIGSLLATGLNADGPEPKKPFAARERLPEWMKPLYNHGLLATLDDDDAVVSVTTSRIVTDELLAKLAALPWLRELYVESTQSLTPAGLAPLAKMSRLEKLTLYHVNAEGPGLGDDAIRQLVGRTSLRELSLGQCGTTDAGAKLLEQLPQLTSLSLSHEPRLTDEALKSIGKLTRLKSLTLSSYVGTPNGWMRFSADGVRQLRGLQELEHLHLVGHEVPADALAFPRLLGLSLGHRSVDDDVAKKIGELRTLQSLELSYCGITNDGFKSLAALPDLRRLDISSTALSDAGFEPFRTHARLEQISLRVGGVTDKTLEHLAQIKTLTRLDLSGSGEPGVSPGRNFSIAGLQQLKSLPKLDSLYLNNLVADGYVGLKELKQLRILSMMMCNVQNSELEALDAALPNTQISHMTGGGYSAKRLRQKVNPAPQPEAAIQDAGPKTPPTSSRTRESSDRSLTTAVTTEQPVEVRLVGGAKQEPLSDVQVEFTLGYGSDEEVFGPFKTNVDGTLRCSLPHGSFHLRLKSAKEWPYLPVDAGWDQAPRGPRPTLTFWMRPEGPMKFARERERPNSVERTKDGAASRVTFALLPATELILRAVDADTGQGLPGVEFYEENVVGEEWARPIDGHNLGWKTQRASKLQTDGLVTDKDGHFKRLVGANAGFKYGVAKFPKEYKPVTQAEVEVPIVFGQPRAEHVVKFRRRADQAVAVKGRVRLEGPRLQAPAR